MIKLLTSFFNALSGSSDKIASEDQRDVNKLQYRIEAAMKYVHCNEKVGEFKDMHDGKRLKRLLHYRKRVFDV